MAHLRREIAIVGVSDMAVLITGETGVGKELVAHHIHAASSRADEALIHVNCAALPVSIAESELFGHVAGAFTGATRDRAGKFEVADGGTLYLDEIGELSLESQPKLLRAVQHGEIQRVGSDRIHRVNVRVIAATNRQLEREVDAGRFRADLYHRLAVFPLHVPPLRERREDVLLLAAHFAESTARRLGVAAVSFTEEAKRALLRGDWPGNVRELDNVVGRGVLRAFAGHEPGHAVVVNASDLDMRSSPGQRGARNLPAGEPGSNDSVASVPASLGELVESFERQVIRQTVERNAGNWAAAARDLGLHRSNLHRRAQRIGLKPR
jgi:anaerobic nitric oxide reductase transcription regulator